MMKHSTITGAFAIIVSLFVMHGTPYGQTTLRRPISPEKPMWLVHIDTWNKPDPQKIIDLIPEDIRPYAVMNISLSVSNDSTRFKTVEYGYETAKSWVRSCAANQMWCMIQCASGSYTQFPDTAMGIFEEFFRDYPNFIGFNYAEQFWGYSDNLIFAYTWERRIAHFVDLMKLNQKYGGYLVVSWCGAYYTASINPVAMMKRNPAFAAICKESPENFILCEKYTSRYGFYDIESTCLGTYLSGYCGNYGIRFDQCGWNPYTDEAFPVAAGIAPVVEHVALTGETVIDGPELIWQQCFRELSAAQTSDGYTERQWGMFPQFVNISIDLFRKILDGTIRILSRREVIDRTKVVIINDVTSGDDRDKYSAPLTLFDGLYAMDGTMRDNLTWFKKTGRYPAIPTVYQLGDAAANSFQVKVNKSAFSTRWPATSAKVTEFNTLFPQEYTGDIYAGRHENCWMTYNPFKSGQVANGSIPFKYNSCDRLELSYAHYSAGIIKEYRDSVTLYLNNYDNAATALKTDVIKIYGSSSRPVYSYKDRAGGQAGTITESWSNGVFTLNVPHNGPLDISVRCTGTATGRLTNYTRSGITAPARPPVFRGPYQHEAECFDYKNIDQNVTSGYGEAVRNYTGQGYLRFGTSAGAKARAYVTVSEKGVYGLETRYAVTGADLRTIDLYVNGTRAETPLFIRTAALSNWSLNKQNITLDAGGNTIEFAANAAGASPFYIDNIVVIASATSIARAKTNVSAGYAVNIKPASSGDRFAVFIRAPEGEDVCVELFDVSGKRVFRSMAKAGSRIVLDKNKGSAGLYYVVLSGKNTTRVVRSVIKGASR
ncbi:MAG: T9SS type A sorting domain-containing protein [Chitinispirillaceae bacterium]|nr:T9SS type A sorting domain-containing protein [Chitinispirillaceae bacterium]